MLLVQLGIKNTRPGGSSNFGKICKHHSTTDVLLIPNCTRQRMITYTKPKLFVKAKTAKKVTKISSKI